MTDRLPVYCLAVAILWGYALHAPRLPIWVSVAFVALCLVQWGMRRRPNRLVGYVLLGFAVVAVYSSYGYLFGREPGLALLPLLAVLKFGELHSHRDFQVLVMLGLFMVASHFIHAQGLYAALLTLPVILLLLAACVLLHGAPEPPRVRRALLLSARMGMAAIPFMIIGFVLFPRLPGPLWSFSRDPSAAITGLSNTMTPGSISQLSQSDAIAFRVRFHGNAPDQQQLYWRGPVLWYTNGSTWSAGQAPARTGIPQLRGTGIPPLIYTVTLEPSRHRRLFAIDVPAQVPERATLSADLQLLTARPIRQRIRYQMSSYPQYHISGAGPQELQRALQLPPGRHPETVALARSWQAAGLAPRAIIDRALRLLREGDFTYTLSPQSTRGDSVDFLLFESREGFCEHYAAALAVLARAAGIPARIVTGYQGGTLNQVGNYYTIRQRDAHAWVEIWDAEQGWRRVDPTRVVAPARVQLGLEGLIPDTTLLGRDSEAHNLWTLMQDSLDAANNGWNQWVIGYDQDQQRQLLYSLGGQRATPWTFAVVLAGLAAVLFLGYLALLLHRQHRATDPTLRAYQRFVRKLARIGIHKHPAQGPLDFARKAAALCRQSSHIHAVTRLYIRIRYGDGQGSPMRLHQMVRRFSPRLR